MPVLNLNNEDSKQSRLMAAKIGLFALFLIAIALSFALLQSHDETRQWREAARPVFKSRGTVDITDHATPHDLQTYLDPCSAIDWRERGKLYKCDQTSVVVYHQR